MLVISSSAFAAGQRNNLAEVFAPVDAAFRPRLSERLQLYVEYERTQQWGNLYDLMYKPYINNMSRDEFIRRRQFFAGEGASITLDFVPQVTLTSRVGLAGNYIIEGCLKTKWRGQFYNWHAGVDAYLENGEWHFTDISTITGIDAPPQPCRERIGERRI